MMDTKAGRNNFFHRQNSQNECVSLQESKQATLQ